MSHKKPQTETVVRELNTQSGTHSPLLAGRTPDEAEHKRSQRRKLRSPSYLTYIAAFGAVLCWIGAGLVLYKAHDDPIDNWPLQPSVYLSILSVLAAICLRSSHNHASAVQWWANLENLAVDTSIEDDSQSQDGGDQPQTKEDKKEDLKNELKQAHKLWQSAHSVWSAIANVWRDKKFSTLSTASIIFAILPASSPLLQKASYAQGFVTNTSSTFPLAIRTNLHGNFTGIQNPKGLTTSLTQEFASIISFYGVNGFYQSDNITGCTGDGCTAILPGLGLHATCYNSTTNSSLNVSDSQSLSVFDVTFNPGGSSGGSSYLMTLTTTWKANGTYSPATNQCLSVLNHSTCTFTSALVGYNASVGNGYVYLASDTDYTIDEQLDNNTHDPFSYWSGVYFLLDQLFDSSATLAYSNNQSNVTLQGYSASAYLDDTTQADCNKIWDDPTHDLLESVRRIAFTAALALAPDDQSPVQNITAYSTGVVLVYRSSYLFLGVALAVSALSLFVVLFMASQGTSNKKNPSWSPTGLIKLIRPDLDLREDYPALLRWLKKLDGYGDDDDNESS